MKCFIVAIAILAVCLWGTIYADRRVAADCQILEDGFKKIADAAEKRDKATVKRETDTLEKQFDEMQDMLCVFSDHEWTEDIHINISTIQTSDSFQEIKNTCGESDTILSHIVDACEASLPNIF